MKLFASKARPPRRGAARRAGADYGAAASPGWREVDWREHLRSVEVDGRRINLVDTGASEGRTPVVLVHGLGGCWQNWLENIPRLADEGRRVIALDLPGFGHSQMSDGEVSISNFGRCVEALCEELGLGGVALVGNSMGGFVGVECAIQYPHRVERLVLVAAAGISTGELSRRPVLASTRVSAALGAWMAAHSERVVTRPRLRRPLYGAIMRHPQLIPNDLIYEVTHRSTGSAFRPAFDAMLRYDVRDRLTEIRCPTLIVWGADDMLVPLEDANKFERAIPSSRKVVFEDTGHVPMIERPKRFNDCLVEFLSEEPPRRPTAQEASFEAEGKAEAKAKSEESAPVS